MLGVVTACGADAPSESEPGSGVPTDVRSNLRAQGTIVDDERRARTKVDMARAIRTASDYEFGRSLDSAHLVRYTNPDDCEYANELDAGQPETAHCTLLSVNRLAWLVVYRGATLAVHGPPGRRGPDTYEATVAAFVDARTGEDLGAETLPPG
jgi:hypothetical protein